MKASEILDFDQGDYHSRMMSESPSDPDLCQNIFKKRRQRLASRCGICLGFATGNPFTAIWSLRREHISDEKLGVLERLWAQRGWARLPSRKRDVIVPLVVIILTLGIGYGLEYILLDSGDFLMDQATTTATNAVGTHMAYQTDAFFQHPTTAVAGDMMHNSAAQMQYGMQGFGYGVEQGAAVLAHQQSTLNSGQYPGSAPYVAGVGYGVDAAKGGVHDGFGHALNYGAEKAVKRSGRDEKYY